MYLGGGERDVPTNAHRRLAEAGMPYIAYPPPNSTEVMRYVPRVDTTRAFARGEHNVVFIGQIPRLLPLPYVPWAIDLLAQEYASKWVLQTQPNGCAKVWVETDAQCELLVELNKRLMFDVCGVFLARTHDEVRTMEDYQQALKLTGPLDGRVPRCGVLVERVRAPVPDALVQYRAQIQHTETLRPTNKCLVFKGSLPEDKLPILLWALDKAAEGPCSDVTLVVRRTPQLTWLHFSKPMPDLGADPHRTLLSWYIQYPGNPPSYLPQMQQLQPCVYSS